MSGKGSDRRPMDKKHCSPEEFRNRWDTIFKKTPMEEKIEKAINKKEKSK